MKMLVTWTDRTSGERRQIEVDATLDVLAVVLEEQRDERLPALTVNVNSDAVIVESVSGSKLWRQTYIEMMADAAADGALTAADMAIGSGQRPTDSACDQVTAGPVEPQSA